MYCGAAAVTGPHKHTGLLEAWNVKYFHIARQLESKKTLMFSLLLVFCGTVDGISYSSCTVKSLAVWTYFHQVALPIISLHELLNERVTSGRV